MHCWVNVTSGYFTPVTLGLFQRSSFFFLWIRRDSYSASWSSYVVLCPPFLLDQPVRLVETLVRHKWDVGQQRLTRICAGQLHAGRHCRSSPSQRETWATRATGCSRHHLDERQQIITIQLHGITPPPPTFPQQGNWKYNGRPLPIRLRESSAAMSQTFLRMFGELSCWMLVSSSVLMAACIDTVRPG